VVGFFDLELPGDGAGVDGEEGGGGGDEFVDGEVGVAVLSGLVEGEV